VPRGYSADVILGAGLLVLVGLGLFIAGLATGTTALYWATVGVCALAAVLLVLSRRRLSAPADAGVPAAGNAEPAAQTAPATPLTTSSEPPAEPEAAAEVPTAVAVTGGAAPVEDGEPPVEEVEVTDLLLVMDLEEDVLVLDEHPRYHLAECPRLAGQDPIPLPLDEARTDGFTPCGVCSPDRTMAQRARARRAGHER
jgi:hypothetical protein